MVKGRALPFPVVTEGPQESWPFTAADELPDDAVYLTAPNLLGWRKEQNTAGSTNTHFESLVVRSSAIGSGEVTIPRGGLSYLVEIWPGGSYLVRDKLYVPGGPRTLLDFAQSIVIRRHVSFKPGDSITIGSNVFTYEMGGVLGGSLSSTFSVRAISGLDWTTAGIAFNVSRDRPTWAPEHVERELYQGRVEKMSNDEVTFAWLSSNRMSSVVVAEKDEFDSEIAVGDELSLPNGGRIKVASIDPAQKRVTLESSEGAITLRADFDQTLLPEDTEARHRVLFVGKKLAVRLVPQKSSFAERRVHLEVWSGLHAIEYGQALDGGWRAFPIGCYTGHLSGIYYSNEQPIRLSPSAPTVSGPGGAFKIRTQWEGAQLASFQLEDAKGGTSVPFPAKGRKSMNLVAGDGPTVRSLFSHLGHGAAAQLYEALRAATRAETAPAKASAAGTVAQASAAGPDWQGKLIAGILGVVLTLLAGAIARALGRKREAGGA